MLRQSLIGAGRATSPLIAVMALVAVVSAAGTSSPGLDQATITMLVNLTIVVGLYVFVGNSGVLSFGHVGFVAIGAYVSALATIPPLFKTALLGGAPSWLQHMHWPFVLGTVAGMLAAVVLAFVVGLALVRLSGIAAGIGTLAFLVISNSVITNANSVTLGASTLPGVPLQTTVPVALAIALVAMTVAYMYQCSRWGLRLRATREDEVAARASGIRIGRTRLGALIISAALTAVGGSLYAHQIGALTPSSFYFDLTFLLIAMLVIGGMLSLAGAVVGCLVVSAISQVTLHFEKGFHLLGVAIPAAPGLGQVILGALMLGMLILRPEGLTGGREFTLLTARAPRAANSVGASGEIAGPESVLAAAGPANLETVKAADSNPTGEGRERRD